MKMLDNLRLETLVGLGAASLLGYVLWGPKTTKPRAANAAGALAGLQNIGNSCFLNAVLQALASSPAVIKWLSSPPSTTASQAHRQLRAALIDVIQVVNRTHPEQRADPFTPAGVVTCLLRLGWLIRRDEQDTHEMFYVLCAVRWENFESLSLPLPAAPRLQALSLPTLLGQFSAPETVHDVKCDSCQRRGRFSKRSLVAKLPPALCLHLPRTTWQNNGQAGKRGDHVAFYETLNMFPYTYAASVTTPSPGSSPPSDSRRHVYRLTAVIVHSGGAHSGHFVTYRRRADPTDSSWFYTSDTLVSRASASEVFSSAAYMLFYDRVAPSAAVWGCRIFPHGCCAVLSCRDHGELLRPAWLSPVANL
ncbi:Ubiquitin carboxyl-terminal hydrolase 30 [Amphibalanus amphitrite]|uniref:ubiquitinyl hydrolase 1 n=1 Tax=Amphibalanus amphitrite TaxID=1232801 RepID=A0A6A4V7S8_AMPAM|nr:Ubiquitin carboxyl-terminal hydrolase 30 [Amphibalanus amphitrite]